MRHAYLILAHKSDSLFFQLLRCLDDEANDIFIHMDKKNRSYDELQSQATVSKSVVYHCRSRSCNWGGFSLVEAELSLLDLATGTSHYDYYHLISGADLPIKSQTQIHEFFEKEAGKEFIRFQSPTLEFEERIRYYYPFQESVGNKKNRVADYFKKIQKHLHVRRNKGIRFQKGTQWFSITDDFARHVLAQRNWIHMVFHHTLCPDEFFMQTLLINSPFKDNLYHKAFDNDTKAIMRLIDWQRGFPYVFRMEDFEMLMESEMLFARKFDPMIDNNIIDAISRKVCSDRQ